MQKGIMKNNFAVSKLLKMSCEKPAAPCNLRTLVRLHELQASFSIKNRKRKCALGNTEMAGMGLQFPGKLPQHKWC